MYFLIKYLIRLWRQRQARRGAPGQGDPQPEAAPSASVARQRKTRSSDDGQSAAMQGPLVLLIHQVRSDVRTSLRNPRARFFTFFFPILLLVVFNGVFGNGHTVVDGTRVDMKVFYVPGILAMSIVVATYAGLVVSLATLRETGVLKRRRATPVPPTLMIAGQALSAVVITAVMATILLVIAKVFYGIGIAPAALAAVACTVLIGTSPTACTSPRSTTPSPTPSPAPTCSCSPPGQ